MFMMISLSFIISIDRIISQWEHWDVPLYIDDVLSLNDPKFGDYVDRICPFDLK
jgi:hypothetical protein